MDHLSSSSVPPIFSTCTSCRICGNKDLVELIDLGSQALTSIFPRQDEASPPAAPQALIKCDDETDDRACGLVQMKHTVSAGHLYTDNYGYRSGLNATMTNHLAGIVAELQAAVPLGPGDVVLDIGANDATLLSKYQTVAGVRKLAIDPSGTQFKQYYPADVELVPEFFTRASFAEAMGPGAKAKIVTTISMFYDLPEPQAFADDVASILDPAVGMWLMEQSYMPSMIQNVSFDTICHEHLEYYTLKQIEFVARRAGLRVVNMSLNDCNGGSFRVALCHERAAYASDAPALDAFRRAEREAGWHTLAPYRRFEADFNLQRDALLAFLRQQKRDGRTIAVYGASTKGNTLLQYYGIGPDLVACVAERNPRKFGHKTPGSEIPITSEAEVRALKPHYMLVLPWHFKQEFLVREARYLREGGTFVFPLPHFDLVSASPARSAVVLGGSGQVGHYLTQLLVSKGYRVFDLSRSQPLEARGEGGVVGVPVDATNLPLVHATIMAIKPDEVYNLAAVTDSNVSLSQPVMTHALNCTLTVQLIETVKALQEARRGVTGREPVRFFQAGSTEIFKGHPTATEVDETSLEAMHPKTPYAVAKLAAFWSVKLARESDPALFACTGVCSNIESPVRRDAYVTKKIVNYFKKADFSAPLRIGSSSSMCDWVHARDVADAIFLIAHQPRADDYIISAGRLRSVAEFALEAALQSGAGAAEWRASGTRLHRVADGAVLAEAGAPELMRPFEQDFIKKPIRFDNAKLLAAGWKPSCSALELIVEDMMLAARG